MLKHSELFYLPALFLNFHPDLNLELMIKLLWIRPCFFRVEHVHHYDNAETLNLPQPIFIPIQGLLCLEFLELDVSLRLLSGDELVAFLLELRLLHGELESGADFAFVKKLNGQRHGLHLHVTHQTVTLWFPALVLVDLNFGLPARKLNNEPGLLEVIVNLLWGYVSGKPLDVHVWRVLELFPLLILFLFPLALLTGLLVFAFFAISPLGSCIGTCSRRRTTARPHRDTREC
mmetsp:Transcript_10189/g.19584  ORF Transcript_10189/g.19584 Transcript_10189/m.19584 type:complete len:232 (+) Transcript_10189:684-1379(+)